MARVTAPLAVHAASPAGTLVTPPTTPGSPPGDGTEPPHRPTRWRLLVERLRHVPRRLWVALLVLVVVAAAVLTYALTRPPAPAPLTQRDVDASVQKGLEKAAEDQAARPADGTVAYAAVQPSLVLISTKERGGGEGTGAGVIVNAEGTILTALHVVANAEEITVSFADGTKGAARVAARQAENDIATLTPQVLPETVVPAVLGGGVTVGTPVFAVGHPLGLTNSVSAGVVSALDRSVRVEGKRTLEHLIQIDAAVNPGNSGGPLLNKAGQVVGIVTGLANPTDESLFVGIGFAVPIATAGGAAGSPPH